MERKNNCSVCGSEIPKYVMGMFHIMELLSDNIFCIGQKLYPCFTCCEEINMFWNYIIKDSRDWCSSKCFKKSYGE